MGKIKLIIFDVGGTLTDFHKLFDETSEIILKRLYGIRTKKNEINKIIYRIDMTFNVSPISQKVYKRTRSGYSIIFTKAILKHFSISESEVNRFENEWWKTINWNRMEIFPDVMATLQKLKKKYLLATVANVHDSALHQKLLRKLKLKKHFHLHVDSDSFGWRKPHPEIFKHVINHFKVKPKEAVMVGDTPVADIAGANKIDIHSILINRKKLSYKFTKNTKPEFEITNLRQLFPVLRKLEEE